MNIEWVKAHKYQIAAFVLFLLAWSLRANIDGLPLEYPGTIKAADPMYHALAAQTIVDDEGYGRLAPYFAQGYENMIDPSPPLNYLASASIVKLTGLPSWVVMYLLVTFFEAAGVLVLFWLCSKLFESELIGLVAGGLYLVPFGLQHWWYGMYIGLWNNVGGFFFFYASLLLAYEYWKNPSRWAAFALSLTVAGTWLVHVAELFITAFAVGFVGLRLLWKVRPFKEQVVHAALMGVVPVLSVVLFWPRYQELSDFLTAGSGGTGSFIGWYYPQLAGLPFYTSLSTFPWWLLIIAGLGAIQVLLNWRKYLVVIVSYGYLVSHLFVFPWFLSAYYFFVRQRMSLPFLIAPLVAYSAYHLVVKPLSQQTKLQEWVLAVLVVSIMVGLAWPQYAELSAIKQQEHLTPESYAPLVWIQENTPEDSRLIFVTGYYQMSGSFAKRVGFVLDAPALVPQLQEFIVQNGTVNLTFPFVGSNGDTEMASSALDEGSFFTYGRGHKYVGKVNVLDFDYAVFKDFQVGDQPIVQAYNQNMIATLVNVYHWTVVYDRDGIRVVKRGVRNAA